MGGPTGNGAIEATASTPARAPALALIDGRGEVVRLTDTFRAGFAPGASAHLSIWDFLDPDQRRQLTRVLEGRLLRADLALPSALGSVAAEAEAVLDAAVMRHALLTVAPRAPDPDPQSGADTLLADPSLDESPAIVWIKDLSGRYMRINRRYTERLGIDDATIKGKGDGELSPTQVVDGSRLLGQRGDGAEPVQLEYTVGPFEGREALTVLRFPLHGLDGMPVAVCGVAAPVAQAATARSEAERLLRIERWAGLSAAAIRAELIQEWQLAEVEPAEPVSEPAPGSGRPLEPAPSTPASAAELEQLREDLGTTRATIVELETLLAETRAANADLESRRSEERARSVELEDALAAATNRADELVTSSASADRGPAVELEAALAEAWTRAEAAERAIADERARTERAEAEVVTERMRAERAEREALAARARVQGVEREIAAARARVSELKNTQGTAAAAEHDLAAERAARAELEQRLAEALRRVDEAEHALAAERAGAGQAHGELVARAERAEQTLAAERAEATAAHAELVARAERAEAAAGLACGRAEGLEAALASARQVGAENGAALEQARAEIASLHRATEQARAEADAAPVVNGALAWPPSLSSAVTPGREAARSTPAPGPAWGHGAQRALTTSLAEASDWRIGLKDALRVLGEQGGWEVAVAWCPDERANVLRCVAMWMAAPAEHGLFETSTWQRRLSPTGSEVGRAADGDHAQWVADMSSVDDAQLTAAAGEGLQAALLVPIRHGEQTSGVLELLTGTSGALDPGVVTAMEAVALQLGHFDYLLRRGAEPRWRIGRL